MEKAPDVRIVCIADTHNFHSQIDVPDGDVLIVAGDVCVRGSVYELAAVNEFLGGLPHSESDKPITQVAKDLGINANTLHTWLGKYSRPAENDKTVRTDEHLY